MSMMMLKSNSIVNRQMEKFVLLLMLPAWADTPALTQEELAAMAEQMKSSCVALLTQKFPGGKMLLTLTWPQNRKSLSWRNEKYRFC
jgi:glycosyltransferase A (GT-A) superfamily protein (DUF2064 family)